MLVDDYNVKKHQAIVKGLERFFNLREVILHCSSIRSLLGDKLQTGVSNVLRLGSLRKLSLLKYDRVIDFQSPGLEELYVEARKYTVANIGLLNCPNLKVFTLVEGEYRLSSHCLFHDGDAWRKKLCEGCPRLQIYNGYPLADLCKRVGGTTSWLQAIEVLGSSSAFPDCSQGWRESRDCAFLPLPIVA
jgi:hypothetical protein